MRLLDAAKPDERGPLRTCIATRRVRPASEMLRFVVDPQGTVVPDLRRRLPGRGVWITATAAAVRQAERRQAFARGFKRQGGVAIPAGLAEKIDRLMEREALQWLAMANKAGEVVAGSAKLETAAAAGSIIGLIHASDGSAEGVRKLEGALARLLKVKDIPRINLFRGDQLDLALGRSNVVHAGLIGGGASREFLARCGRIEFYRSGTAADPREDRRAAERHRPAERAANGRRPLGYEDE